MKVIKITWVTVICFSLFACTAGQLATPGIDAFEAGDFAGAETALEEEFAAGELKAGFALGHMYLHGKGVAKNIVTAEQYLLSAAVDGETRAVKDLIAIYSQPRCEAEEDLAKHWAAIGGGLHRSLVSGDIQMSSAPVGSLQEMARLYDMPCTGVDWDRKKVGARLRKHASMPRKIYIYVPSPG